MARAYLRPMKPSFLRARRVVLGMGGVLAMILVSANVWVLVRGRGSTTDATELKPAKIAIVFGARVWPNGTVSEVLADRLETARALYRAGLVQELLLTGDHHAPEYDEVAAMRRYLVKRGVPDSVLRLDGGGIDTYSSIVRAQTLFGANDVVMVSQAYHLPRTLYVARARGMKAQGIAADRHVYRGIAWFRVRELLSRTKAIVDVWTARRPKPFDGQ